MSLILSEADHTLLCIRWERHVPFNIQNQSRESLPSPSPHVAGEDASDAQSPPVSWNLFLSFALSHFYLFSPSLLAPVKLHILPDCNYFSVREKSDQQSRPNYLQPMIFKCSNFPETFVVI